MPTGGGARSRFLRAARLRKHADFEKVYRSGRRILSAHMTVFFLRRDSGPAHLGFTVRRALGTAVERNRIRRRLREAARLNLGAVGNAVDVVIHPKKSALTAEFAELCQEVARAFEKIRSSAERGAAK
jgi:ribonuclease P protein component